MRVETVELGSASPGQRQSLQLLHFGGAGAAPKAYIQAALHADEIPALLVAQRLRRRLSELEAAGQLIGEVVLVPFANPIGLAQQTLGLHQGRFDYRDGVNFNRLLPDVAQTVADAVQGKLGSDAAANVATVRVALREAVAAAESAHPAEALKRELMLRAIDADIVLDLHCDSEAVMHLYGLTPQADLLAELGALLGARAILLATESGDSPFDEACSRPWLVTQMRDPALPLPLACFATTVELRGQADTASVQADSDAAALIEFLRRRGVVAGVPAPLPVALCEATPLAASEPVTAPRAGVVVFHAAVGARVAAGDLVAELVDVETGEVHPLHAQSAGMLYARIATRWATPGLRLAKIAGTTLARTGKLLGN